MNSLSFPSFSQHSLVIGHDEVYPQNFDILVSEKGNDLLRPKAESACVSQLELNDCTMPCFDIFAINSSKGEEREKLITDFCTSLRQDGFVILKAESLAPLIDQVYQQAEGYFSQEDQLKMKDKKEEGSQEGYDSEKRFRETYQFSSKINEHTNLPEFNSIMQQYYHTMSDYTECALQLILEHLNVKTDDIIANKNDVVKWTKLIKYKATSKEDTNWLEAHKDVNLLTIHPYNLVPGLQFLNKENQWIDAVIPKGYFILNLADGLEQKTAGYFRAVEHRVLSPGGMRHMQERYAAAFAIGWPGNFSLKPFESCFEKMCINMSEEEAKALVEAYPDVTTHERFSLLRIEICAKGFEVDFIEKLKKNFLIGSRKSRT